MTQCIVWPATAVLSTGQTQCHDTAGTSVPCPGSGQDAAFAAARPEGRGPRFALASEGLARDQATGLLWPVDAGLAGFPRPWSEALALVAGYARDGLLGRTDWRLPNRRELRSLISYGAARPALPPGHPFQHVFTGWYWSATTAAPAPAYAWYVHLEGGRMFYGKKDQDCLVWPVAGRFRLPQTGQERCYDSLGREVPCAGTGQDGEIRSGTPWPSPRFEARGEAVHDRLTGLIWAARADGTGGVATWEQALAHCRQLGDGGWRLPTINELESLVDAGRSHPALPDGHPFSGVGEAYWSSTTSAFENNWAHALYLQKGAVGVGIKSAREFLVWPVRGPLA
ncbi:hypothetical protein DVDV_3469 [Desulfovibrio sp. DV]|uniref:Lcl C-terminal domain-containing protein n=1 Tax=Desulfovibrio sp. DV TaxID=1844708 RepID=UPI00094BBE82|nr:DUF1566 domain-containing protein [Desulfovibrio sp. DV]OLN25294.1 hypothetical protein DVDV_3469 [Desulfovibrio sp. DV]